MLLTGRLMLPSIAALLIMLASGCDWKKTDDSAYKVFGTDAITDPVVLDRAEDAPALWKERGISGATLILVDAFGRIESSGSAERDFVANGLKDGTFTTVYWVMPYEIMLKPLDGTPVRRLVAEIMPDAPIKDLEKLRYKDGCLVDPSGNIKYRLCSPLSVPFIKEPVVMSINLSFIKSTMAEFEVSSIAAVREMFESLRFKDYKIKLLSISTDISSGQLHARDLHIVSTMQEAFINTSITSAEDPPIAWNAKTLSVSALESGDEYEFLDKLSDEGLKRFPADYDFRLFKALAEIGKGMPEGVEKLDDLCGDAPAYCAGYIEAGDIMSDLGRPEEAVESYKKAIEEMPGNQAAKIKLALALLRLKNAPDALAAVESSSGNAALMVRALAHLAAGEKEKALPLLDEAMKDVYKVTYQFSAGQISFIQAELKKHGMSKAAAGIEGKSE